MAEGRRMTAAREAVEQLLQSEHGDVLRESVAWMVAELMEAEVAAQIGAELGERAPGERLTQRKRLPPAALGHARRRDRAADPQAPSGQLLPVDP